ncbi:MAG: sensor histidine kinase, partial [Candidatus Cloacimonadota bacterium]|nr:sensor histidine kinase [Candidatus Cloacimonadota bacterium]
EKDKSYRLTLFLIVLLFIVIAIFLFHNNNKNNKLNKLLEETNEELEDKVALRTSELVETNENLREEIIVRKETEDKLTSSLDEKDVMLKEIQHRVKNNLQIISSILNLQSRASDNEESIKILTDTYNRIMTMSLVEERLYASDDFALVDFDKCVRSLIDNLSGIYRSMTSHIKFIIDCENIFLNLSTAVPCGLLINEIVSNAIKHGFPDHKKGEVVINMKNVKDDLYMLKISNNGVSMPPKIDYDNPKSAGMELIRVLIIQLSADVEITKENGVLYKLKFKKLKN